MAKTKQKKQHVRRRILKKQARRSGRPSRRARPSQSLYALPLVYCKVNSGWREGGATIVVVARQSLGHVKVDGEVLTVSVRGKSWMLIMNQRLGEAFGADLARGPLDIQDPMELINSSQAG